MNLRNLQEIARVSALTMAAWSLPPVLWRRAAMITCKVGHADRDYDVYQKLLGPSYSAAEILQISHKRRALARETKLQILGLNGPWRSWFPGIRLNGKENLAIAREKGKGAILWVTETAYNDLIAKMALHRFGYRAVQLSRPDHGFSGSSFGMRYLNPLWARVENRFIEERIMITGDRPPKQ
jgi:hypothetical protein